MNRRTGRRALRAVPPLVVLAAIVAPAAPAYADPPTSTGGVIVITDPGPRLWEWAQGCHRCLPTEQVVVVAAAGLPPPIVDD